MADRFRMDLKGFDEVKRRLEAIGPELATKAGQSSIRKAAKIVADEVKAQAPVGDDDTTRTYKNGDGIQTVDYGHLRDNIKVRKGKPRKQHTVVSLVTIGNAFWGRFLEYGTVKMIARPFFKPAFDSAIPKAIQSLERELGKALDRIVKRLGGKS